MRLPARSLALALLGVAAFLLALEPELSGVPSAAVQGLTAQTAEYGCTGRPEPLGVPPGVTQLTIEAEGAAGHAIPDGGDAGRGGRVRGTLAVTPGALLTIEVG